MATNDIHVPTDTEGFWEWLRKRGERQQQENSYVEATIEIPKPSKPKPLPEDSSSSNNDIWTDVNYTIYEL
jgi:hypothetical protein